MKATVRFNWIAAWVLATAPVEAANLATLYQENSGGVAPEIYPQNLGLGFHSLFWWRLGSGAKEFPASSALRWQSALPLYFRSLGAPLPTTTQTVLDQSPGLLSVTRDESYFYYIYDNKLYRKAVNATATDSALEIPPTGFEPLNFTLDAVAFGQGQVYYALDATPSNSGHQFELWTYNPANGEQQFQLAADGPAIQRMMFFTYHPSTSLGHAGALANGLFLLGTDGTLMRHDLDGGSLVTTLNTAIQDFVLQNHKSSLAAIYTTTIYAVKQLPGSGGGSAGGFQNTLNALFALEPTSGGGVQVALDPSLPLSSQPSVSSLAADQRFVFAAVETGATGSLEAYDSEAAAPSWYFIATSLPSLPVSMASDGAWLYLTDGSLIQRIPTDAPPLELDAQAFALEAVQTVQNLNNDVQLVAGKPTFVRVYANLATNTTGLSTWYPTAELHGSLNGVEFPDSPISPAIIPPLVLNSSYGDMRPNIGNAYLFQLSIDWVQAGSLSLTATVDPDHTLPESGPVANNTVTRSVTVTDPRVPTLVFVPLANSLPDYDPTTDPDFGNILARGKSLLPVTDFKVFLNSGTVYKKVFRIRTGREVCFPVGPCITSPIPLPGIDDDPFTVPDDKDVFVLWTAFYSFFNPQPANSSDVHWIGTFDKGVPSFNGIGGIGGTTLGNLLSGLPGPLQALINPLLPADFAAVITMRTNYGNDSSSDAWSSIHGGQNLAHELGHNYGRNHILQESSCGSQVPLGPYDTYPYDPCTLGPVTYNSLASFFGFDSLTWTPVPPDKAGDLMSYSSSAWTSDFTWNALLQAIPTTPGVSLDSLKGQPLNEPNQSLTFLSGHISWYSKSAQLLPAYTLPSDAFDATKVTQFLQALAQAPANFPLAVRLVGQDGTTLATYPLFLLPGADGAAGEFNFAQPVPFVDGTHRLQIMQLDNVIAERLVSPSAPVLTLGTPVLNGQLVTLNWTASDPDGDFLTFAIQYSADNGQSWLTIDPLFDGLSVALDTTQLPGGETVRLRILASDGVNSTAATSTPFAVPMHPPQILISGARQNERLPFGGLNSLHAIALDVQEGSLPSGTLKWSFVGPTQPAVSTGDTISLIGLPPGQYSAAATATDMNHLTGSSTRHFQIGPVPIPDAAAPQLDGLGSDPGYAQAATLRVPLSGGQFMRASLLHAAGTLYVSFADLPFAANGTPPNQVQLFVDTTGSGGNTPQTTDLGFTVDENAVPSQQVGNGTALHPNLSPPGGFSAVVFRGSTSWSAEFSIAESLVGGWNHAAALMVSLPTLGGRSWPPQGAENVPSTWAAASFGTVPVSTSPPPTADAGPARAYNVVDTQTILLDGSASFDPAAQPLTYSWTQSGGPTVTLSNTTSAVASFTVTPDLAPATLTFALTVSDERTNSSPAQTTVTLQAVDSQQSATRTNLPTASVAAAPDGSVSGGFTIPGEPGESVVIQASVDLSHWTTIQTNSLDYFEKIAFLDPDAPHYPHRFYRPALISSSTAQPPAPLPGLVSLWHGDGDTTDFTGQNSGTAIGNLSFAPGKFGQAFVLDGTTACISIPDSASLKPTNFTFLAWVNFASNNAAGIVGGTETILTKPRQLTAEDSYSLTLEAPTGLYGRLSDPSGAPAANLFSWFPQPSVWYHVAEVWTGATLQLYINGALAASGTAPASLGYESGQPLLLGAANKGSKYQGFFNGLIDEVSFYNRALSQTEVQQLYGENLISGTAAPGSIGYNRDDSTIWLASADGQSQQLVTLGTEPRLSPNSRYLLFRRSGSGSGGEDALWVRDLETGQENIVDLRAPASFVTGYAWMPQSDKIVFDDFSTLDFRIMNRDGSNNLEWFKHNPYDQAPVVSLLNSNIVFHSFNANVVSQGGLYFLSDPSAPPQLIPNTKYGDAWAAWSADGQWLSFSDRTNLFIIHPDGMSRTPLTALSSPGDGFRFTAPWTSDGRHVVSSGVVLGTNGIYSIATDGFGSAELLIPLSPFRPAAPVAVVGSIAGSP